MSVQNKLTTTDLLTTDIRILHANWQCYADLPICSTDWASFTTDSSTTDIQIKLTKMWVYQSTQVSPTSDFSAPDILNSTISDFKHCLAYFRDKNCATDIDVPVYKRRPPISGLLIINYAKLYRQKTKQSAVCLVLHVGALRREIAGHCHCCSKWCSKWSVRDELGRVSLPK